MKVLIEIPVTFKLRLKATNVFDIESRDMTKMICSPEPIDITKRLYDKIDNEEKKITVKTLVQGLNLQDAFDCFMQGMKNTLADFDITSISETAIIDVYPVETKDKKDEPK